MIDPSQWQFTVDTALKNGDGSWDFFVVVYEPSPVLGAPVVIRARAQCHVHSDRACAALAEAIHNVAGQIPPEILSPIGRN